MYLHIIPDKYQFEARVTITFKKRQDAVFIFVFQILNLEFEFDWVVKNENLLSIYIVVYSKFLRQKIVKPAKIARQYIYKSINNKKTVQIPNNDQVWYN